MPYADSQLNRKKRVLIIDDELMVLQVLQKSLHRIGFEVVAAKDGMTAIEEVKAAWHNDVSFFAVIVDINLGEGLDGYETVRRLKEIDPEIRAIAFTAFTELPVSSDYPKYGFKAFLPKPFSIDELKDVLAFAT